MENNSVVVVGIAKDIASSFERDYERISNSLKRFSEIFWFIVESDSIDESVGVLERIAQSDSRFSFRTLGNLSKEFPKRTERLAYARNSYLNEISHDDKYSQCNFVVVTDFNDLNSMISSDSVDSCFKRNDWDACFANQDGRYYDIWALRHELWSPNDCWEQLNFYRKFHNYPEKTLFASVQSRMIKIPPLSEWIHVESAFGGFGIYKMESIKNLKYSGVNDTGLPICEHVPLNLDIGRAGGKLFINPRLLNCGVNDHTSHLRWRNKFIRLAKYPWKFAKNKISVNKE